MIDVLEYALTRLGRTLEQSLAAVRGWGEQHINEVNEARHRYDLVGQ